MIITALLIVGLILLVLWGINCFVVPLFPGPQAQNAVRVIAGVIGFIALIVVILNVSGLSHYIR